MIERIVACTATAALAMSALAAWAQGNSGETAAEQGKALLMPFKKAMQGALLDGLSDGPAAAVDACRVRAPQIAAELATDGVKMGRSSHRLRNPENRGPDWIETILETWPGAATPPEPVVVELDGDSVGYVEPIMTQGICLTCHGDAISEPLAAEIARLYPDDQATGFAVGDLRGVFWVEFTR